MSTSSSPTFSQSLSPLQRRLATSALALFSFAVISAFLFGIFLLLRAFVNGFAAVLWPLATAGIIALILRPVVQVFEARLKLGRVQSIVLLFVCVVIVLVGVGALLVPTLFEQTLIFFDRLPEIWANLRDAVAERFPEIREFLVARLGEERLVRYQASVEEQTQKLLEMAVPAAQDMLSRLTGVITLATGLAIIPVYLFFFLKTDRDPTNELREQLSFLRDDWRDDIVFLIREFAESMVAFFRGQILIGLIMGVLLAIGFSLAGVNFGIVLGLLVGALNIIPYFGTIIGLGTVLPIAWFQPEGGPILALIALGVFVVVQMIEGYFLTPRIMGKQTGLHPLTIIIAIFFWGVALNGLLGMILAIPLTAFFVVAWRLAKRKYLAQLPSLHEGPPAER
ncbi:MAG: AI-2E family transporter [Opitutales bacterium]